MRLLIAPLLMLGLSGCPRGAGVQEISPPRADCDPGDAASAPPVTVAIGGLSYGDDREPVLTPYVASTPTPLIHGFQGAYMLVNAVRLHADGDLGDAVCARVTLRDEVIGMTELRESITPWEFEREVDGDYYSRSFQFVLGEHPEELVEHEVHFELIVAGATLDGTTDVTFPLGPPEE